MATQSKVEENNIIPTSDSNQGAPTVAVSWSAKVAERYGMIKTHAETYPFVWCSYILAYGAVGSMVAYKWRALRKAETRVQILQERLRKRYEAEEQLLKNSATDADKAACSASSSTNKPSPSADGV